MTIGNVSDAARALAYGRNWVEGITIGEGSSRTVHLINGVAYKVTSLANNWINDRELSMYDNIDTSQWPEWLRLPVMTGYSIDDRTIVAAEFVPGIPMEWRMDCSRDKVDFCNSPNCMGMYRRDTIFRLMFTDAECWGNTVQHVDGTLYLVDLPD